MSPSQPGVFDPEIYRRSLDCVHCGLCLTSCPTYLETGRETSSPRGRIYLMRGVAEGRIELAGTVAEEAFLCLGCRACESACPAGVGYGAMLELARADVVKSGHRNGVGPKIERFLLRQVVAHQPRLRALVTSLGVAQRLGLDRLARHLMPARFRRFIDMAPVVPPASERVPLPPVTAARGQQRGRVAFFTGCIMSEVFAPVHRASIRVLAANGFEVVVPDAQGCCGALHAHAGDLDFARGLARRNAAAFDPADVDAIVVNSAGCGAALRELPLWIGDEGGPLSAKIRDISEVLDAAGLRKPPGRVEARVCYDDPCHLVHGQKVSAPPRRLLQQIDGIELVPHADASACCGAAGTYNLTHPEMSARVLERKMESLAAARPDVIATGNPGCMMQLRQGVAQRGLSAEVVHPIELLDRAYSAGGE
jgi:glycolate oxidase iron-sulfur subunit